MRAVEVQIELLPQPLTPIHDSNNSIQTIQSHDLSTPQATNLYTSHLLSTWNARTYEFGAIIFTAAAYPDTLVASSMRGIITTIASICFSASLGRWIDSSPNRLKTLLATITANRISVIAACVFWVFIIDGSYTDLHVRPLRSKAPVPSLLGKIAVPEQLKKNVLFAAVLLVGVVEKLSAVSNMMSMERDWVVTVAAPDGKDYDLMHLNAVMRRIDLICKLVAPIAISFVISISGSVRIGVLVISGMSAVSGVVEWWCAKRVWNNHPALQEMKTPQIEDNVPGADRIGVELRDSGEHLSQIRSLKANVTHWLKQYARDTRCYFSSKVWIPSLALSLLHLSVLAYSATFITYLLNVGLSLNLITIARAVGSVVEITSTVVTPFGVDYLGKAHNNYNHTRNEEPVDDEAEAALLEDTAHPRGNTETGLERLGLWGITGQLINLLPVVLALWALSPTTSSLLISPQTADDSTTKSKTSAVSTSLALIIFTFLCLSRLGLWIYDLTTQQLTQTLVPASSSSSFAGVENSFISLFELGQNIFGIMLSKPEQFKYLAVGSWCTVGISAVLYAGWVRERRGHLVHWERLGKGCECIRQGRFGARGRSYQ